MRKVIDIDKNTLLVGDAGSGFIYAAIDKDNRDDLALVYQFDIDGEEYAVTSAIAGRSFGDYDELGTGSLERMLSILIDSGYTVLQFEDIGEFGSWIVGQKWRRPEAAPVASANVGSDPEFLLFNDDGQIVHSNVFPFNILVTPTKRHAIDTLVVYKDRLVARTLCGLQETFDRDGTRSRNHEGWYLARIGKKEDYPIRSKRCQNCTYSVKGPTAWTPKNLDNVVTIRRITG